MNYVRQLILVESDVLSTRDFDGYSAMDYLLQIVAKVMKPGFHRFRKARPYLSSLFKAMFQSCVWEGKIEELCEPRIDNQTESNEADEDERCVMERLAHLQLDQYCMKSITIIPDWDTRLVPLMWTEERELMLVTDFETGQEMVSPQQREKILQKRRRVISMPLLAALAFCSRNDRGMPVDTMEMLIENMTSSVALNTVGHEWQHGNNAPAPGPTSLIALVLCDGRVDLFLKFVKEKQNRSDIKLDLDTKYRGKNALEHACALGRNGATAALLQHYPQLAQQLPQDFLKSVIRKKDWKFAWQAIFEFGIQPTVIEFAVVVSLGVVSLMNDTRAKPQRTTDVSEDTLLSTLETKGVTLLDSLSKISVLEEEDQFEAEETMQSEWVDGLLCSYTDAKELNLDRSPLDELVRNPSLAMMVLPQLRHNLGLSWLRYLVLKHIRITGSSVLHVLIGEQTVIDDRSLALTKFLLGGEARILERSTQSADDGGSDTIASVNDMLMREHHQEQDSSFDPELLQVLLDSKDAQGDTPLHAATRRHYIPMVKLLLDLGACVSIKNNQNRAPHNHLSRDAIHADIKQRMHQLYNQHQKQRQAKERRRLEQAEKKGSRKRRRIALGKKE